MSLLTRRELFMVYNYRLRAITVCFGFLITQTSSDPTTLFRVPSLLAKRWTSTERLVVFAFFVRPHAPVAPPPSLPITTTTLLLLQGREIVAGSWRGENQLQQIGRNRGPRSLLSNTFLAVFKALFSQTIIRHRNKEGW
jgi:hypothetical protein